MHIAFLSKTGKSLVCRIEGNYIDSKGYFKGAKGQISGYINSPLAWICKPVKKGYYNEKHIFKFDFGDNELRNVIEIPLSEYCINN